MWPPILIGGGSFFLLLLCEGSWVPILFRTPLPSTASSHLWCQWEGSAWGWCPRPSSPLCPSTAVINTLAWCFQFPVSIFTIVQSGCKIPLASQAWQIPCTNKINSKAWTIRSSSIQRNIFRISINKLSETTLRIAFSGAVLSQKNQC